MEFKEFIDAIIEGIKEKLDDVLEIDIKDITKNNGIKLKGIVVKKEECNIAPTIYMESYYEEYRNGSDIEEIVDRIIDIYRMNVLEDDFNVDYYMNFDAIKNKLFCKVINTKKNEDLLKEIPYEAFYDLSLVVYCQVNELKTGNASILVRNSHLEMWQVNKDEVLDIAKNNTRNNIGMEIAPICEAIRRNATGIEDFKDIEECVEFPMYVVTSTNYIFGAVFMCFEEHLKSLAERIGGDYYILPSSVHEIIILRADKNNNLDELGAMVKEVNENFLEVTDILSEHAYLYSKGQEVLIF